MARANPEEAIRPSLLDRLIGNVPKNVPGSQLQVGVRELKRAVARDLEWLLNTVVTLPYDMDVLPEARTSILNFGIPDFTYFSWTNHADAATICRRLEQVVKAFEPRLLPRSVRVEVVGRDDPADFSLRFRIDAVLHVEPISEPVSFDTSVELDTGEMRIERAL